MNYHLLCTKSKQGGFVTFAQSMHLTNEKYLVRFDEDEMGNCFFVSRKERNNESFMRHYRQFMVDWRNGAGSDMVTVTITSDRWLQSTDEV